MGVRAIFVLLHNFNKATTAGYSFNDFNDLLSSIAAPIHHDGEVLDADAMSELEAAVEEYKEEIRSKIRKAADWHNLAVMVRPADAAVLGTLYIAITVRNNKTSIESGRWNAKAIVHAFSPFFLRRDADRTVRQVKNAQVLSGSIVSSVPAHHCALQVADPSGFVQDTIRQISESLPRAPGDPTSAPGSQRTGRALPGLDVQEFLSGVRLSKSLSPQSDADLFDLD